MIVFDQSVLVTDGIAVRRVMFGAVDASTCVAVSDQGVYSLHSFI